MFSISLMKKGIKGSCRLLQHYFAES